MAARPRFCPECGASYERFRAEGVDFAEQGRALRAVARAVDPDGSGVNGRIHVTRRSILREMGSVKRGMWTQYHGIDRCVPDLRRRNAGLTDDDRERNLEDLLDDLDEADRADDGDTTFDPAAWAA